MKKLLSIFFVLILLSGCITATKVDTPKEEVDNFFSKYTSLDEDVITQLKAVINTEDLTDNQKDEYEKVFKRQYENMKYTIKNEQINDNNAIVNVEIEVYDLFFVKQQADSYLTTHPNDFNNAEGTFDKNEFWDYKIDKMQNASDRKKYTLDLTLTRIDDNWRLDNLLDSELQKIHGLFQG